MATIPSPADIRFVPMSTDEDKIRFFGTLMPALLLLKASPGRFVRYQVGRRYTPRVEIPAFVDTKADDAASVENTLVFVHRWHSFDFDPFAFARAKTFLARITRLVRRAGFRAEPLDPLSPSVNLPKLAARAGLGTLSPFGLLVHPAFGPRLILTALRTDYALELAPRWPGEGCSGCLACVGICPQEPLQTGIVELRMCQRCTQCLAVCPVGVPGARGRSEEA
jgi:ferredoxin